jgi:hypothetical protein
MESVPQFPTILREGGGVTGEAGRLPDSFDEKSNRLVSSNERSIHH